MVLLNKMSIAVANARIYSSVSPVFFFKKNNTAQNKKKKSIFFCYANATGSNLNNHQKQRQTQRQSCTAHDDGSEEQLRKSYRPAFCPTNNNKLFTKLRRYGISGILSYGLLNTVYYLTTFFFVWFYIAPAPGRLGYVAAVERFLKVMAMVWVGSQVTKLARAAGALAFAPLVSRGLTWFTRKFKFESEGKAFMAIAGFCFGLALLLFFSVTLLWA